jgi:hypothetical protein
MVITRHTHLMALLYLCGCGVDAGVAGSGAQQVLSVDSDAVLQIDGTASSGELVFGSAVGGTVLEDGTIVIADGLEHSVRFFNEAGVLVRSVGRKGEGPGEFNHIGWIGQCGTDSVFIWDPELKRMTLIDAAGTVVTSYRVPDDPTLAAGSIFTCSRDGVFAVVGTPSNIASVTEHYSAPLWLADTRGVIIRELGDVLAFEGRPLGRVTSIAVSNTQVYVGTKDSLYVDVYERDGNQHLQLIVADSLRAPSTRHYELAIDVQVARLGSVDDRRMLKEYMLRQPMPEWMPPYSDLFVDPADMLWVQLSLAGDPDTWLRVFSSAGDVVATVRLPFFMRVFEIGPHHLLSAYDDDNGEPHVALFRIQRNLGVR